MSISYESQFAFLFIAWLFGGGYAKLLEENSIPRTSDLLHIFDELLESKIFCPW